MRKLVKSVVINWDHLYLLHSGILLLLYLLMKRLWLWFRLPESSYYQSTFIDDFIDNYTTFVLVAIAFLALMVVLNQFDLPFSDAFKARLNWSSLPYSSPIKYLILVAASIMLWSYSTYDLNLYFGQWHVLERALLLISFGLLVISPIGIFPFLLVLMLILAQFQYPTIFYYSWTDKLLVIHFLFLVSAFVLGRYWLRLSSHSFVFVTLCMVGAFYFVPGVAKLTQEGLFNWLFYNQLDNLWITSYISGWMRFLSQQQAMFIASIVEKANLLGKVATLIFELGGLLILFHKRGTQTLLVGAIGLHVMILLSSGIFFWKWLLFDTALLIFLLYRHDKLLLQPVYKPIFIVASLVIIPFGHNLFDAPFLGWLDSGIVVNFDVEIIENDGDIHNVSRMFFSPYDIVFAQNRFGYLVDEHLIVGSYGAVRDMDLWNAIQAAEPTAESLNGIRDLFGTNQYNESQIADYQLFMQQWFGNYNRILNKDLLPSIVSAPHHIFVHPPENPYRGDESVETVRVIFSEYMYRDDTIYEIQSDMLFSIPISEK